ncbi:MAG: hypothetical protein P8H62_03540 [Henriciella sp.]|nr:hypothetical protein [Henriciella sp.]
MTDQSKLVLSDVKEGAELPPITMPITLHRLVMEAGANRDFSFIHHDKDVAKSTGAPDVYANTFFLMGLFERQLREWIGVAGKIKKIGPMQMMTFNCVGDVLQLTGKVVGVAEDGTISIEQVIESERGVTTKAQAKVQLS